LAKQFEEVYRPGLADPVRVPRGSEALYLLQRVRDEAHRFAITYHRAKRTAAQRASALDAVPGLGPARKAALLRHFGSVRRLKQASAEQVAEVDGFGPRLAEMVTEALREREDGEPDAAHGPASQNGGLSDDQPRGRA
jgi:excinuclease ABC subunit C